MLMWILMAAGFIICAGGLVWSMKAMQSRRTKNASDGNVNAAIAKHTVVLNPIHLTYIFFAIAVIIIIFAVYFIYT
ncbi:hypothetical protein QUF84_10855 [Fictibacillus enclensis]|uniref:hypothetical protein n=1 Tax=Fictibacillus enclensis TaxID=1017270 RepID=UPI0025A23079|nr:hypothetical protein [Fictibacillus enclensis]MDM5337717.1 hypothetical protein [Fictibacillus enclensis]